MSEPVTIEQQVREFLIATINEQGLSYREVARLASTDHTTVRRFLDGERNPGLDVVDRIIAGLGYTSTLTIEPSLDLMQARLTNKR